MQIQQNKNENMIETRTNAVFSPKRRLEEPMSRKTRNFITDDGNVYILGEFDESISTDVIFGLVSLINQMAMAKNPELHIYINSNGGYAHELFGLLSILETAKKMGIKIITHVIGIAYSAASMLAVSGDYRTMSRYSDHLLHLGTAGCSFQTYEQLERETNYNVKHFNKVLDIYSRYTKISKKKLTEMLKDDKMYLDAKQCLELGLCDEIE